MEGVRRARRSATAVVGLALACGAVACSGSKGGAGPTPSSPAALSGTPVGLTVLAESGGAVRVSWKAPAQAAGITGYTIYRGGTLLKLVSPSLTSYLDDTVDPEQSYSYEVEAVTGAGRSPRTASVSVTTPPPPPVSDARVEGRFLIDGKVTKTTFTNYHAGSRYRTTWYFDPTCDVGACDVKTGGDGNKESVLRRKGAGYSGKVSVPKGSQCGKVKIGETETISFRVTAAHFLHGVWLASKIQGTFRIDSGAALGCSSGYSEATFTGF